MKAKNIFGLLAIGVALQACNSKIDVTSYPKPAFYKNNAPVNNSVKFSLSVIETGYAETLEAFVYKGGSLFKKRKLSHVAILIQHPKATFVFDTGLGSEIEAQFHDNFSFLNRQIFQFTKLESLKETLIKNNFQIDSINFIIPSHLHFDHASGIEDFPNSEVLTTKEEYKYASGKNATPPAFIKEQYDAGFIKWKFMDFDSVEYEIFHESLDLFQDGSIVLVKLPGHTNGSIGMFVNLSSGKRYFFTGDLTWAAEAFFIPSEKHIIPRKKVDLNQEKVREMIVNVHYLLNEKTQIIVVPAHDAKAQKSIAHFPEVEW